MVGCRLDKEVKAHRPSLFFSISLSYIISISAVAVDVLPNPATPHCTGEDSMVSMQSMNANVNLGMQLCLGRSLPSTGGAGFESAVSTAISYDIRRSGLGIVFPYSQE